MPTKEGRGERQAPRPEIGVCIYHDASPVVWRSHGSRPQPWESGAKRARGGDGPGEGGWGEGGLPAPGRRAAEPLRTQDPRPGGTQRSRPRPHLGRVPGAGAGRGRGRARGVGGRGGGRARAAGPRRLSPPERGSLRPPPSSASSGTRGSRLHAARPCCNRRRAQVPLAS